MPINVLRATKQGQGQRANDFSWTTEGELVRRDFPCDNDRRNPDGGCGCGRSMPGLDSSRGTTTAVVAEAEMTREEYIDAIFATYEREGWTKLGVTRKDAATEADYLLRVAAQLAVGTVVECRTGVVAAREVAESVAAPS